MLPAFIIEEQAVREAGNSPALDIGDHQQGLVLVTLGITRILEQESIDVSIWGSADGNEWGAKPLATFPQKFYCGTYQIVVDLTDKPEVKFLRAKWTLNRWGKGDPKPLFGVYLFAQELQERVLAISA